MAELIRFTEHLIADGYNYAYGISAADLTGNGVLDIVSADTDVGLVFSVFAASGLGPRCTAR